MEKICKTMRQKYTCTFVKHIKKHLNFDETFSNYNFFYNTNLLSLYVFAKPDTSRTVV